LRKLRQMFFGLNGNGIMFRFLAETVIARLCVTAVYLFIEAFVNNFYNHGKSKFYPCYYYYYNVVCIGRCISSRIYLSRTNMTYTLFYQHSEVCRQHTCNSNIPNEQHSFGKYCDLLSVFNSNSNYNLNFRLNP